MPTSTASSVTKPTASMTSLSSLTTVSSFFVVCLLLLLHVHTITSAPTPIHMQRRQSFFRCTGWGAGCSNLDYTPYPKSEPRRVEQPLAVARSGQRVKSTPASSSSNYSSGRNSRNGYGLHFLFTSGTSWGANGKRSSPFNSEQAVDSKLRTFRDILQTLQDLDMPQEELQY